MGSSATFVVPGDIEQLTGGYIYEKQLLLALRRIGWEIELLQVPGEFPDAKPQDIAAVAEVLAALPAGTPVILDGFLPGAMPPETIAAVTPPFVAITHHPLGYETGLAPDRAQQLREIERANLARAAHIIVPSPHTAETLASDFGVRRECITVAAPGVARPARQDRAPDAPTMILSVGQLVPRKGHDVFLEALHRIADRDWTAEIVGAAHDRAYERSLRDQAERLGLAGRIRFAGLVPPEELHESYGRASVFALATRYEGYGMVFAEALVHGLPIVTCRAGAVADTVPSEAGLLVAPDDAEAFAGALCRLLDDQKLRGRLSVAAAAHGRRLPTWEDTARIVADVLAGVELQARNCSGA